MEGVDQRLDKIARLWFDSSAEALVLVDDRGNIAAANSRSVTLFGYPVEELLEMTVEQLIPNRFRDGHHRHREGYLEHPTKRSMGIGLDLLALKADGSEIPVEISMNRLELDGVGYTMALVSDVSRRKQIEQRLHELNYNLEEIIQDRTRELRESQLLHEIIARQFPNGTINVLDRNFDYVFAEGEELFRMGVTSERLIGSNYLERLAPEIRNETRHKLEQVFQGEPQSIELLHKENYYLLEAVPLETSTGELERILVVEHNISQRKASEIRVQQALEKERELGELKSRFVSMASHEFRTPLSSVMSSTQILQRYLEKGHDVPFSEKWDKHLHRIHQNVQNLNQILHEFLSLDKLESGVVASQPEPVLVREIFDRAIEDSQGMQSGHEVVCSISGLEEPVALDGRILRNILINLLSNAFKYSPEASTVDLIAVHKGTGLQLAVRDRGMGIPEAEQRHLFERFFRAQNAVNIQGTGLGLVIVRRYLDLMGGSISFESEVGKGTTFHINIPFQTT